MPLREVRLEGLGVIQQENRNVDVGPLFFGNCKKAAPRKSTRRIRTPNLLLLEFSEDDVYERQGSERAEICFLIGPGGPIDQGSEVMGLNNIVVRLEQLKEALQVQALKGTAANRAVVKVELYRRWCAEALGIKKEG